MNTHHALDQKSQPQQIRIELNFYSTYRISLFVQSAATTINHQNSQLSEDKCCMSSKLTAPPVPELSDEAKTVCIEGWVKK